MVDLSEDEGVQEMILFIQILSAITLIGLIALICLIFTYQIHDWRVQNKRNEELLKKGQWR